MGSSLIPLQIATPKIDIPSPIDIQARGLSLQAMAQQNALNQSKIQEEHLKAQQLEEDRRDSSEIQRQYADAVKSHEPGKDFDYSGLRLKIAPKVGPRSLANFDKSVQEHLTAQSTWDKDRIELGKYQTAESAKHLDAIRSIRPGDMSQEAENLRAAEWAKRVTLIKQLGYDPQNQFDPTKYPGYQGLDTIDTGLKGAMIHLDEADKAQKMDAAKETAQREAALAEPKLTEAQTKASVDQRAAASGVLANAADRSVADYLKILGGIKNPELRDLFPAVPEGLQPTDKLPADFVRGVRMAGQTAPQQQTAVTAERNAARAAMPNTIPELEAAASDPTKTPAEHKMYVDAIKLHIQDTLAGRPITNVSIPGLGAITPQQASLVGEDYLKTLPTATANQVRAIMTGRLPMPPATSRQPAAMQLRTAVMQADPNFSDQLAQKRKQVMSEFASSSNTKAGGQLLALNTLVHHADLFLDIADSLKNHSFVPGNAIYNKVATVFGATPPTEANLVARFLAGEAGKVATGGVPAEGEINGLLSSLNKDGSPEQLQKVGRRILDIASGRMVPLREKAADAGLVDSGLVKILGPDAKEILERRGFDPETMRPKRQDGGTGGRGGTRKPLADIFK